VYSSGLEAAKTSSAMTMRASEMRMVCTTIYS
jgi:hypothetical protein